MSPFFWFVIGCGGCLYLLCCCYSLWEFLRQPRVSPSSQFKMLIFTPLSNHTGPVVQFGMNKSIDIPGLVQTPPSHSNVFGKGGSRGFKSRSVHQSLSLGISCIRVCYDEELV